MLWGCRPAEAGSPRRLWSLGRSASSRVSNERPGLTVPISLAKSRGLGRGSAGPFDSPPIRGRISGANGTLALLAGRGPCGRQSAIQPATRSAAARCRCGAPRAPRRPTPPESNNGAGGGAEGTTEDTGVRAARGGVPACSTRGLGRVPPSAGFARWFAPAARGARRFRGWRARVAAQRAPVALARRLRRDAGAGRGAAGLGARLLRAAGRVVPAARPVRRAARAPPAAARPGPAGRAALRGPRAALGPGPAAAHEQRALLARGRRGARRAPGPLRGPRGAAHARGARRAGRLVRALPPLAAPAGALRGAHPPAGLGRPRLLPGGALRQPARRLRVRAAALPPARAGRLAGAGGAAPVQAQGGAAGAAGGPAALDRLQRGQQPAAPGRERAQRRCQGPVTIPARQPLPRQSPARPRLPGGRHCRMGRRPGSPS